MQKIVNLNQYPFLRDRLIITFLFITVMSGWIVYNLSKIAGGWYELHQQTSLVLFIELLPLLLLGILLFITSSRLQSENKGRQEKKQQDLIHTIATTLDKIKTGQFDKERDVTGEAEIDSSLRNIFEKFKAEADEERHRSWINEGLAMFRQVMSSHTQIKPMCEEVTSKVVKYINASQGGIFIRDAERKLELISCYAYERKKYLKKTILPGEGLAGQCYLEGHRIYLTKVPQEYVNITSGLGSTNPGCILIHPLKLKDETLGVIEVASLHPLKPYQLEFMERVAEALAQSISTIYTNEQTKILLDKSLGREQEMKDQEELMKQSLEELYVTQEEMKKINREMEEIFKAINTLTATVELDSQGQITKLNDRFAEYLLLDAQDIYGKKLTTFLKTDAQETALFSTAWSGVLQGKALERILTFENAKGETRWLRTGLYPLQSENGTERILCFLSDVSEIMLKETELNKLNKEVEGFQKMLIRILNEIPLKIFLKQYNGKFFVVNDAVSRFHGFETPAGLIGKSDFDFYDHQEAAEWLETEHKIIAEGRTEYIHEDGGKILQTVKMPFYIDPLDETGLLGFQADITELEGLKKKLKNT